MALTLRKEMLLVKLNQAAQTAHTEAVEVAQRKGRAAPAAPAPLTERDIEFPKWLHKGWKATSKGKGHFESEESRLAANAEEVKELLALGFTEEPPAPPAKEAPKK